MHAKKIEYLQDVLNKKPMIKTCKLYKYTCLLHIKKTINLFLIKGELQLVITILMIASISCSMLIIGLWAYLKVI